MCCWHRFLWKPDIRRLKVTESCELCPNPHQIAAHLSPLSGQTAIRHRAKTTLTYLWWHKDKHKTDVAKVTLSHYMVTLTLWKYQYGKLCLVIHVILQPGSNTKRSWKPFPDYINIYILHLWRVLSHLGQYIKHLEQRVCGEDVILWDTGNCMSHCSVATFQDISVLVWIIRDTETLEGFTARKMPTSLSTRAATERKYRRGRHERTSLKRRAEVKERKTDLLVTRWRSFISALSNHTWGQDLTMALWRTPIKPPCIWPTWQTHLGNYGSMSWFSMKNDPSV